MRNINMPAKVLAVFEPGHCPVPYKVKVLDQHNNEFLLYVDLVRRIDTRACNTIIYDCVSFYEDHEKQFRLLYNIGKYQWSFLGI